MKKLLLFSTLLVLFCVNNIEAQNSMVGDGFGGRLWYKPTNYTVGSYSGYTICYDGACATGTNQLYGWGWNFYSQLGYPYPAPKGADTPIPVPGMTDVKYYSCGYSMGAIKQDNSGWVWGKYWPSGPKKIIDDAYFLDASSDNISFVKTDGTVWTVGSNITGAFGDGTKTDSHDVPKQMLSITNAVRVANNSNITVVLLSDGSIKIAGRNFSGLLGIGSSSASLEALMPIDVLGLSDIVDIKATARDVIALDKNGDVYGWGFSFTNKPIKLGYKDIVAISGCDDGSAFFLLDKDKTCFQINALSGDRLPSIGEPDVIDIMAGELFGYVVKSDGSLWGIGISASSPGSIWLDLLDKRRSVLTKITPELVGGCTTHILPYVDIEASKTTVCLGGSTTLSVVPLGASTYTWSTSDVSNDITVTPTVNTVYTVATSDGTCTTTGYIMIYVNTTPTLVVNSPTICYGLPAVLIATGNAIKYDWSTGDIGNTLKVSPTTTTQYTVTGTNSPCPIAAQIATVTVMPNPTLTINSSSLCSGNTTTLVAIGADSYTWALGAVTNSIVISPTITTNYTITGESSLTGCKEIKTITVTILSSPTLTINSPTICTGQTTTLNVSGASSYTWSTGANTNSLNVSPITSTTYTVFASNALGCDDTKTTTVTVYPNPLLIVNSATICLGQTAELISTGADTYSWSTGESINSINVMPSTTTIFTVIGTNSSGCNSIASSTVIVYDPEISINTSTICTGQTATLNATGVNTYTWSTGDFLSSIIVSPTITSTYTVDGTDGFGCKTAQTTTVDVIHTIADFSGLNNTNYILSEALQLELINQSTNADLFSWSLCNTSFSENRDAYLSLTDTGYCCIKLIAQKESCIDSITKCFYVECDATISIPNVFTPNGDGVNDRFKIKTACLKTLNCTIFDRWGLKLFEWDGIEGYWDGKSSTGQAPSGTYYYIVRYSNLKGDEKTEKGFLTLFKD